MTLARTLKQIAVINGDDLMVKILRKVWAGLWLACGVALAAVLLPAFLLSFGVVLGVRAVSNRSRKRRPKSKSIKV